MTNGRVKGDLFVGNNVYANGEELATNTALTDGLASKLDTANGEATQTFTLSETGNPPDLIIRRDNAGGSAAVNGNDVLRLEGQGWDGDSYESAARIRMSVNGSVSDGDVPGSIRFDTATGGSLVERARISTDGLFYLNTRAVDTTSGAWKTTPNYGQARIATNASASNSATGMESTSFYTATRHHIAFSNPNGVVGSISTNTNATAYNTSSDYRLKDNVEPISGALARLGQLKPIRFEWKSDPGTKVDGFLAHEAQTVVPEAVTGEKDEVDENGNPTYQGIDQSKLVPLLVAAVQELQAEVAALKAAAN